MTGAGNVTTVEVKIDGREKRRSLRNILARSLMEGYDEKPEQMRFQLLTADLALDTLAGLPSLLPLARRIVTEQGHKVIPVERWTTMQNLIRSAQEVLRG